MQVKTRSRRRGFLPPICPECGSHLKKYDGGFARRRRSVWWCRHCQARVPFHHVEWGESS